ncbi:MULTISPECIES: hypothetical protein [unclassified Dysgonomonas]|uniref:hypothetical protein n=1 Tax=unclassified Dysgonomonas TaxID=2630389 RepID=UPI0013EE3C69|nr:MULTISPECIES: hypothetical protein [unclassified Dysgonomonas]
MLKLLRYAFYRAYRFGSSYGRNDATPLIVLLSMPIIANVYIVKDSFHIIMRYPYLKSTLYDKILLGIEYVILFTLLYRYLASKKRIKVIFKEFEDISNKEKYILNILYFLYLIVSFTLAICLSNIIRAKEYLNW